MRTKFSFLFLAAFLIPPVWAAEKAAPTGELRTTVPEPPPPKPLAEQLKDMKDLFVRNSPPEKVKDYDDAIQSIRTSGLLDKAVKAGGKAPSFELTDLKGEKRSLASFLEKGPLVLVWYRGGWCPYCSLELNAWQKVFPELQKMGVGLAAVSPEVPEDGNLTAGRNHLSFDVLTDRGNQTAKQFGLVYTVPEQLLKHLKQKVDFKKSYGSETYELPLSAVYLIGKNGVVQLAFLDPDWRERADPERLLQILKGKALKKPADPAPAPASPAPSPS